MKTEFLRRSIGSSRLLLIFAGWGSGPRLYESFAPSVPSGWDILVAYDYDSADFPSEYVVSYHTVYLIAWSLGVAAAESALGSIRISRAVAINGTPYPVHDNYGIPVSIYDGTNASLNPRNLQKFRRRMVASSDEFKVLLPLLPENPDIDGLQAQLSFIKSQVTNPGYDPKIRWERAYVASDDHIIPTQNQIAYWSAPGKSVTVYNIDSSHFPPFGKILAQLIPDTARIAGGFQSAVRSYPDYAAPQRMIAARLGSLLNNIVPELSEHPDVLEIGPGSGLFTDCWRTLLRPANATFIDLYPLQSFDVTDHDERIVDDAETWLQSSRRKFDLILTASSIQWFCDPVQFLIDAKDYLRPGGFLVCSSFLVGNLYQLDSLRPSPLRYLDPDDLENAVSAGFSEYKIESSEMKLRFDSPREALMHLKHTGVSGVGKGNFTFRELCAALAEPDGSASLTYLPVYIIARK